MSQQLTLELSDETFAALQQQAEADGVSPGRLAVSSLEERFGADRRTNGSGQTHKAEKDERRGRFARHFGSVDLGHALGVDNDAIDADLAKEYADNHEQD
jgi:predicted transcriptional regulator